MLGSDHSDDMDEDNEQATSPASVHEEHSGPELADNQEDSDANSELDSEQEPPNSDFPNSDSENSEFAEPSSPAKKTKKSASVKNASKTAPTKTAPKKEQKKNVAPTPQSDDGLTATVTDNVLYSAITAIRPQKMIKIVDNWLTSYQSDNISAVIVLIDFLIRSCGCPSQVHRDAFEDHDLIPDALKLLQSDFEKSASSTHSEYPIIKKSRSGFKIRNAILDFWSTLITTLHNAQLLITNEPDDSDDESTESILENLKFWVITMSSSPFRPFRHTSTLVALHILEVITKIAKGVDEEWSVATRQRNAEAKKKEGKTGLRTSGAGKLDALVKQASDLHAIKMALEAHQKDLFDGVFVHRYRDTDPQIRADCLTTLSHCLTIHPSFHLEATYLRYFGWLLSDKSANVRLAALSALTALYVHPSWTTFLRGFTDRFKHRLLAMAQRELDDSVRHVAVEVCCLIVDKGLVEDSDRDIVASLVCDSDEVVRARAAQMVASVVWEEDIVQDVAEHLGVEMEEADEKMSSRIKIKALVRVLVSVVTGAADLELEVERKKDAGIVAVKSALSHSFANSQGASQSSITGEDMVWGDDNEDLESEDGDNAELNKNIADLADLKRWLSKVLRNDGERGVAVAASRIGIAVASLWKYINFLKEWKLMCEYLFSDFLAEESTQTEDGESPLSLTSEEETALLVIVRNSLVLNIKPPVDVNEQTIKKKKDKEAVVENNEETEIANRRKIGRELCMWVPKLLKKYSDEDIVGETPEKLIEVLKILRELDVDVYEELRLTAAFDDLMNDLLKLFTRNTQQIVLSELVITLKHLCTSAPEAAQLKLEECAETVAQIQISANVNKLDSDLAENSLIDLEDLVALNIAVTRLDELSSAIDISDLKISTNSEWEGVFGLLNNVMKATLKIAATTPTPTTATILNSLLETALNGLARDVFWQLQTNKDDTKLSTKLTRLITIAEAMVANDEENKEATALAFALGPKLTAVSVLSDLYWIVDSTREPVTPPDDVQMQIADTIQRVVMLLECNPAVAVARVCMGKASRSSIEFVQNDPRGPVLGVIVGLTRLVAAGVLRRDLPLASDLVSYAGVGKARAEEAASLFTRIEELPALLEDGEDMKEEAIVVVRFVEIYVKQGGCFGAAWDVVVRELVKAVCEGGMARVMRAVKDAKMTNNEVHEAVDEMALVMLDSLVKAFATYIDGSVATLEAPLQVAQLVIQAIRSWGAIAILKSDHTKEYKLLASAAKGALLTMLQQGVENLMTVVIESVQREQDDNVEIFAGAAVVKTLWLRATKGKEDRYARSLSETNAGWRFWGAIGGAIRQVVNALDESPLDGEISTIADIFQNVEEALTTNGVKPIEGSPEWEAYWAFAKALEKGDSSITVAKRRASNAAAMLAGTVGKNRRKSTSHRGRASSPSATKKGRKAAPKIKKKNIFSEMSGADSDARPRKLAAKKGKKAVTANSESEDEKTDTETTPKPTRRSGRVVTPLKNTYKDIDDSEIENETALVESSPPQKITATSKRTMKTATSRAKSKIQKVPDPSDDEDENEVFTNSKHSAKQTSSGAKPVNSKTQKVPIHSESSDAENTDVSTPTRKSQRSVVKSTKAKLQKPQSNIRNDGQENIEISITPTRKKIVRKSSEVVIPIKSISGKTYSRTIAKSPTQVNSNPKNNPQREAKIMKEKKSEDYVDSLLNGEKNLKSKVIKKRKAGDTQIESSKKKAKVADIEENQEEEEDDDDESDIGSDFGRGKKVVI
ncbi:hypothetical protein HK096_007528 [Nowakowskiella sp. JEL0078]|nr:hypothetical protein HK096_007528 [Nowakowskiella sp. JEL0078]